MFAKSIANEYVLPRLHGRALPSGGGPSESAEHGAGRASPSGGGLPKSVEHGAAQRRIALDTRQRSQFEAGSIMIRGKYSGQCSLLYERGVRKHVCIKHNTVQMFYYNYLPAVT